MSQPFDVFISFKNLDEGGQPTRDAALARSVFDHLVARNLRVFLSSITLERQGVSSYKKAIDQALDGAQVLVAVGTSSAHLNAEWVRYEWDSFFNDVLSGVKPTGQVFVYVDGVVSRELPRSLRQSQMIAHGPGSLEMLGNFIANALGLEAGGPAAASPAVVAPATSADDGEQTPRELPQRPAWEADAHEMLQRGEKIAAIKLVREATALGLKAAKDLVESWHVVAERPMGRARVHSDWEAEARQLVKRGDKIQAIKLVREATALGLKEAKELVESW